jgi:hypothetical protein
VLETCETFVKLADSKFGQILPARDSLPDCRRLFQAKLQDACLSVLRFPSRFVRLHTIEFRETGVHHSLPSVCDNTRSGNNLLTYIITYLFTYSMEPSRS